MSTLRLAAVKKPFFMPMNTGHRFDDAEPTVPMDTLSAARAADGVSRPAQISKAAVTEVRKTLIAVLLPVPLHAARRAVWRKISAKRPVAPGSAPQFPRR